MGIISDLGAATGIISATALAFSVYYSQRQTKALEGQVEELRKQTNELMKKPKIKLEIELNALNEFPPPTLNPPISGKAKYIRIKATNKGETGGKECIAKAEINRAPELGGVLLHWVRYRENIFEDIKDLYRPIDIATNDSEIADLIVLLRHIYDGQYETKVILRSSSSPSYLAYFNDDRLFLQVNDEIHVRVFCSNSEPSNELIITYKKQFDFNTINKDNISQYFEIVQKEEE